MTHQTITRRRVLAAMAASATAATLAACSNLVAATLSPSSPTAMSAPPSPAARPSPAASATPTPGPTSAPDPRTLRQKIAAMLVVGFKGLTVDEAPWIGTAIADAGLGGVILFDRHRASTKPRNVASPEQVAALTGELRALAGDRDLIIAIDQEGGLVTRLSPRYGFPALASEAEIGEQGDDAVGAWAAGLATTLGTAGITLDLAPVVDLNVNADNPAIGALDRAFSAEPEVVGRDAAIEIDALRARGVRSALKHFPGIGSATANTDFGVADVTETWSDVELVPYRHLIALDSVDAVMVGHVVNGQLDPSAPASLSSATVTGLLRQQLGFDGPVVTDDLQAGAITDAFGADDAILLAIEAGCDLLLLANQQVYDTAIVGHVIDLVERAVTAGRITEARIDESLTRIGRLFPAGG